MHITGKLKEVIRTGATLLITFEVNEEQKALNELDEISNRIVIIDVSPFYNKKSAKANRYFWKLCDLIGKAMNPPVKKWDVYLMKLNDYGVFTDLVILKDAFEIIQRTFRVVEILEQRGDFFEVRGYIGLSQYNSKEISDLIRGTIADAEELGVKTITENEIKAMLSAWKGGTDEEE